MMQPVLDRLLTEAELQPGDQVLDIGTGTGASTIAAARIVGPTGHVTGADISDIMLDLADQRTQAAGIANADYIEGDAQVFAFDPARYDRVMSRFGVMFFGDPVAAFANIGRALKPGCPLVFLCWAGLMGNPWFAIPRQAAIDVLGAPAPADPRAPGPMAFAERDYVHHILTQAGWRDIEVTEITLDLTPKGSVEDIAGFATRLGPASRIITDLNGTEADARRIEAEVAKRMVPYDTGHGIRVPATLNLVRARR